MTHTECDPLKGSRNPCPRCNPKEDTITTKQHTPGPWKVYDEQVLDFPRRVAIQTRDKYPETIADIRLQSIGDLPVDANAQLIASAPALLEALEAMLDEFAMYDDDVLTEGMPRPSIAQARTAIALAKGETE